MALAPCALLLGGPPEAGHGKCHPVLSLHVGGQQQHFHLTDNRVKGCLELGGQFQRLSKHGHLHWGQEQE